MKWEDDRQNRIHVMGCCMKDEYYSRIFRIVVPGSFGDACLFLAKEK